MAGAGRAPRHVVGLQSRVRPLLLGPAAASLGSPDCAQRSEQGAPRALPMQGNPPSNAPCR
eukprot:5053868-Lingulodinium_polyedra.AAC.1